MVEPGRRCLGDRYELHQLIAAGGMGQVWRATDIALHRPVAVKVLRSEYTGDPTFLARFRAEAQHAASLSHPNIAAVFDYGEEIAQDGTGETLAYLVMELVEGEPLSRLLAREGRLGTTTTLSVVRQVATALGEAHRAGLVHRDVKPGNILVRPDGSVKITDFGIAWSARSVALTRTGQVIGTPQYLSPEQAEGRLATPASDVYALGLIGYECLTGHPAFDGDNAVTIALKQVQQDPEPLSDEIPAGVRGLIARTLAKDPTARLADGCAVAAVIDDLAAGRPVPFAWPTTGTRAVAGAVPPPRSSDPATQLSAVGSRRPPAAPRRSRVAMVLLPLVALMVGAAIATALFQSLANGRPSATAEAADTAHDRGVVLVAANYVDRPVDVVASELRSYGLDVRRRVDPSGSVAPGLVSRIDPVGVELVKNDVVTVFYVPASSGSGSSGSFSGAGTPAVTAAESTAPTSGAVPVTDGTTPVTGPGTTTAAGESSGSAAPTSSTAPDTSEAPESTSSSSVSTSSAPDTSAATSSAAASSSAAGQ